MCGCILFSAKTSAEVMSLHLLHWVLHAREASCNSLNFPLSVVDLHTFQIKIRADNRLHFADPGGSAWVCCRLPAGIAGSNPSGFMDVCLS